MSTSAFAGSPLLISLELLHNDGLLETKELDHTDFSEYQVAFEDVANFKSSRLHLAFKKFDTSKNNSDFHTFKQSTSWLADYSLFMSMKEVFHQKGWFDWPPKLATRDKKTILEMVQKHSDLINYYAFEQYVFFTQWQKLKSKAAAMDIQLVGDIPIYVGWDSVDVWANQSIFALNDKTHAPETVAGVPPDYFSKTGQRWGNPLYRWNSSDKLVNKQLYSWWTERFRSIFQLVDIARVDHFRGFESYWSIPASEKTAIKGKWVKGPGIHLFEEIYRTLGPLNIIAEDLGEITPEVIELRDALNFPGMKILQFAFDGDRKNSFLPYNFETQNSVIYTGTHDNDTTVGWYLSRQLSASRRQELLRFCNRENDDSVIHRDLIHLALSSISRYAIFPLQDILGFGNDCKMNSPGTSKGNWAWRCAQRFLTDSVSIWLQKECELFGRCPVQKTPAKNDK